MGRKKGEIKNLEFNYICPFKNCLFETDIQGMKSGKAAHHGIKAHNMQPWELKNRGHEFKKVQILKGKKRTPTLESEEQARSIGCHLEIDEAEGIELSKEEFKKDQVRVHGVGMVDRTDSETTSNDYVPTRVLCHRNKVKNIENEPTGSIVDDDIIDQIGKKTNKNSE